MGASKTLLPAQSSPQLPSPGVEEHMELPLGSILVETILEIMAARVISEVWKKGVGETGLATNRARSTAKKRSSEWRPLLLRVTAKGYRKGV